MNTTKRTLIAHSIARNILNIKQKTYTLHISTTFQDFAFKVHRLPITVFNLIKNFDKELYPGISFETYLHEYENLNGCKVRNVSVTCMFSEDLDEDYIISMLRLNNKLSMSLPYLLKNLDIK